MYMKPQGGVYKRSNLLFLERGKEMLQKELELYPESEAFVLPLLKKLAQ